MKLLLFDSNCAFLTPGGKTIHALMLQKEISILAKQICRIFSNDDLANTLSEKAYKVALLRHDKIKNAFQLNSIYKQIMHESIFDL